MQLPRGKFHRIYKSVTIRSLTDELQKTQFTGYCTIALGGESTILVYDRGQVLLAGCGAKQGQHALDDAKEKWDREATAELNILTSEQIKLTREFNRSFEIGAAVRGEKGTRGGRVRATERPPARPERRTQPAPPTAPTERTSQGSTGRPVAADQGQHEELDALVQMIEAMDLETLNGSFRTDCKDLLRRIDLEHLIQDSDA
ncbi:hypothetical protein FGU65_01015 [Methanoculleus sp. FWC-SCC1]|uniref:Uncharacterized protein n=1 Tax=Methanoculleus frigidifontis TaxID=2584085 RepID=A0ABT8M6E1_9EURY|nr:hypothetical protein [Methanoculleus sp. FWC-SCC1]MDN7023493.1 hypothetical protein [Methanoculleus sp. FWC-SCC1]